MQRLLNHIAPRASKQRFRPSSGKGRAELGATIAVASSAPYIQFSLIFVSPFLEVGRFAFLQRGQDYYSVSISRGKVTGVIDLNRTRPGPAYLTVGKGLPHYRRNLPWLLWTS
jgi:hypothetical protein